MELTDEALLIEFRVEAHEGLDRVESLFTARTPPDVDGLAAAFRAIHTIKGNGGFLNLEALVAEAHGLEHDLDMARRGQRAIDGGFIDRVLVGIDNLRRLVRGEALAPAMPVVPAVPIKATTGSMPLPGPATPIGTPIEFTGGGSDQLAFLQWLIAQGHLDAGAAQRVIDLWIAGVPEPTAVMREVIGLTPSECIAVLCHAGRQRITPFRACAELGLLGDCSIDMLEFCSESQLPTVPMLLAEAGVAERVQVLRWMRAFASA